MYLPRDRVFTNWWLVGNQGIYSLPNSYIVHSIIPNKSRVRFGSLQAYSPQHYKPVVWRRPGSGGSCELHVSAVHPDELQCELRVSPLTATSIVVLHIILYTTTLRSVGCSSDEELQTKGVGTLGIYTIHYSTIITEPIEFRAHF